MRPRATELAVNLALPRTLREGSISPLLVAWPASQSNKTIPKADFEPSLVVPLITLARCHRGCRREKTRSQVNTKYGGKSLWLEL